MIVLVCGGRKFYDKVLFRYTMGLIHTETPITLIIHGGAIGADMLANYWAKAMGIPVKEYPADWNTYRRSAGPIRNSQMLKEGKPDLVVAFPGGKGTADMVKKAKKANMKLIEVV